MATVISNLKQKVEIMITGTTCIYFKGLQLMLGYATGQRKAFAVDITDRVTISSKLKKKSGPHRRLRI